MIPSSIRCGSSNALKNGCGRQLRQTFTHAWPRVSPPTTTTPPCSKSGIRRFIPIRRCPAPNISQRSFLHSNTTAHKAYDGSRSASRVLISSRNTGPSSSSSSSSSSSKYNSSGQNAETEDKEKNTKKAPFLISTASSSSTSTPVWSGGRRAFFNPQLARGEEDLHHLFWCIPPSRGFPHSSKSFHKSTSSSSLSPFVLHPPTAPVHHCTSSSCKGWNNGGISSTSRWISSPSSPLLGGGAGKIPEHVSSSSMPSSSSSSSSHAKATTNEAKKVVLVGDHKDHKIRHEPTAGKMERFMRMVDDPDKVEINSYDVAQMFLLKEEDVSELRSIKKENPYDPRGEPMVMYWAHEVVPLALKKHGRSKLQMGYQAYLRSSMSDDVKGKIYGVGTPSWKLRRFYSQPSSTTEAGRISLLSGLRVNSAILSIKILAFAITHSQAIFTDMMHSAADVVNYSYRLLEVNRSQSPGDRNHPYGYSPLRYITADRSFCCLFLLGALIPFGTACRILWLEAAAPMSLAECSGAIFVLLASMGLESIALRTAFGEIQKSKAAANQKFWEHIRDGRDVMTLATFCEAVCGVFGGCIGIAGVLAAYHYQLSTFDAMASLFMSGLVGGTACLLLDTSKRGLLGQTLPENLVFQILNLVSADPVVNDIFDVKTTVVGTTMAKFKAEISFNAEAITRKGLFKRPPSSAMSDEEFAEWLEESNAYFLRLLTQELKRVEGIIRSELKVFPNVHVDLEPV